MATERQVRANRANGLSGGVKTPEGKAVSRMNARKHGIFTSALTAEDAEDLHGIEERLVAELRPVGVVEEMLVEKIALTYVRMQRCARAEAVYHSRIWREHDPADDLLLSYQRSRLGPGPRFREAIFDHMVAVISAYDTRLTNQFLKLLHELERRQRVRAGEKVPPPVVADVTVHAEFAGEQPEELSDAAEEDSSASADEEMTSTRGNEASSNSSDECVSEENGILKNEPNLPQEAITAGVSSSGADAAGESGVSDGAMEDDA